MKNIHPKNKADFALLHRTAISALEECDYDIVDKTDTQLLGLVEIVCHDEALFISNGYREYADYDVEDCIEHISYIVSQHSDYLLSLIKNIHKVVMDNRKELMSKFNPPPILPPDHIIF